MYRYVCDPPPPEDCGPPPTETCNPPPPEDCDPPPTEACDPPPPEDCDPPPAEACDPPPPENCDPPPAEACAPPPPENCDPPPTEACDPPPAEGCEPSGTDCSHSATEEDSCTMNSNCNDSFSTTNTGIGLNLLNHSLNGNSVLSGNTVEGNLVDTGDVLSPSINVGDVNVAEGGINVLPVVQAPIDADVLSDVADIGDITDVVTFGDLSNAGDLNVVDTALVENVANFNAGNDLVQALTNLDSGDIGNGVLAADVDALTGPTIGSAIASLSSGGFSGGGIHAIDTDLSDVGAAIHSNDLSVVAHDTVDALVAEADLFNIDVPSFDFDHHS